MEYAQILGASLSYREIKWNKVINIQFCANFVGEWMGMTMMAKGKLN